VFHDSIDCARLRECPLLGKTSEEDRQAAFERMKGFRLLDLHGARLGREGTLPEDTFKGYTELRMLGLEGNNLVTMPPSLFSDMAKLKIIYLTGPFDWPKQDDPEARCNRGNYVAEDETFCKNHRDAANHISSLHPALFKHNTALQVLLVHHNELTELPAGVFGSLGQLQVLKLLDNAFPPGALSADSAAFAQLTVRGAAPRHVPPVAAAGARRHVARSTPCIACSRSSGLHSPACSQSGARWCSWKRCRHAVASDLHYPSPAN
jgi:hypothetical protein